MIEFKHHNFTEEVFEWLSKYGGNFTYMYDLPHGTKFRVANGAWDGVIEHIEGSVYIKIGDDNYHKVNEDYYLFIDNIKE